MFSLVTASFGLFARRDRQDPRRAAAHRRVRLRGGAGHDVRRLPGAGRADLRLLQAPGTAFLVVAAPEPDALREASYFVERLRAEQMPLAGLVLNRVHRQRAPTALGRAGRGRRRRGWSEAGTHELTAALLRLHAERMQLVGPRAAPVRDRFTGAHPEVPVARGAGAARGRARPRRAAQDRRPRWPAISRPCRRRGWAPPCVQASRGRLVRSAGDLQCARARRRAVSSSARQEVTSRPAAQQRPPLTLGHPAPDPELDAVVERVGEALGPDRASPADRLGAVLGGALDEQRVRVRGTAPRILRQSISNSAFIRSSPCIPAPPTRTLCTQ